MRHGLALILISLPLVGACSLLFNPDDLPLLEAGANPIDATPDAEIILDADPDALALDGLEPSVLVEGRGVGGSYATILVIHGRQLVKNITTVTISAHGETTPIAGITVDNGRLDVSANGRDLAVPVTIAIDVVRGVTTARARLDVTVSQMGASGLVKATLSTKQPTDSPVLELEYLDELTNASPIFVTGQIPPGIYRFSKVEITGGLRPMTNAGPIRIEAVSSISITGVTDFKAVLGSSGAGGNAGGSGGVGVAAGAANPGGVGAGVGGGKSSGGGGGFGSVGAGGGAGGLMSGNAVLTNLALNRSSGGGGGVGGVGTAAPNGGNGGAGGGVIELSAGGDLAIGDLTAIGGDGTAGATNGGGGGGGSGGTILLRAGHGFTTTSVLATGGLAGGSGTVTSYMGGDGRVRIDVPTAELTINSTPASYRGPMLVVDSSLIVRTPTPTFGVVGAKNQFFNYYFTNGQGAQAGSRRLIGSNGAAMFMLPEDANNKPLARGINHFCLLVDGASSASPPEAMNCFDVVYLYTP